MSIQLRDDQTRYGLISVLLHWTIAVLIAVLIGLGLWMVSLSVFDSWYRTAPMLHTSLGVVVALLMLIRLLWRMLTATPAPAVARSPVMMLLGKLVHRVMYANVFVVVVSGYLVATGSGRALEFFNLFSVPAMLHVSTRQVELFKTLHELSVWFLVGLIALHVAAVLKHQLIDKEPILQRMKP